MDVIEQPRMLRLDPFSILCDAAAGLPGYLESCFAQVMEKAAEWIDGQARSRSIVRKGEESQTSLYISGKRITNGLQQEMVDHLKEVAPDPDKFPDTDGEAPALSFKGQGDLASLLDGVIDSSGVYVTSTVYMVSPALYQGMTGYRGGDDVGNLVVSDVLQANGGVQVRHLSMDEAAQIHPDVLHGSLQGLDEESELDLIQLIYQQAGEFVERLEDHASRFMGFRSEQTNPVPARTRVQVKLVNSHLAGLRSVQATDRARSGIGLNTALRNLHQGLNLDIFSPLNAALNQHYFRVSLPKVEKVLQHAGYTINRADDGAPRDAIKYI